MHTGHSTLEVYIHVVWATKNREPFIQDAMEQQLYAAMMHEATKQGYSLLAIGGIADHVHLLVKCPSSINIPALMNAIKGSSSHIVNHCIGTDYHFAWQNGYDARSVSPGSLMKIIGYITNQKTHHQQGSTHLAWEPSDHTDAPPDSHDPDEPAH